MLDFPKVFGDLIIDDLINTNPWSSVIPEAGLRTIR